MTETTRSVQPLLNYRNVDDHPGIALRGGLGLDVGRRTFMTGMASGLVVASMPLAGAAAQNGAAQNGAPELAPLEVGPRVPERAGALSWDTLAKVQGDGYVEPFVFDPELKKLNGQKVTLDGYMLPFDDQPRQGRFLLTAYYAHCPFCIPGGMTSMVEIVMDLPMAMTEEIVSVQGPLTIIEGEGYGLLYQIEHAAPA